MDKKKTKNLVVKIFSLSVCFMMILFNTVFSVNAQFEGSPDLPDWDGSGKVKPPSMEQLEVAKYLRVPGAQTYLDPYKDTQQKMGVGFFIVKFIEILTKIIGSFALLVIIAGGITIMISTGNQNLQTKGKEMIKFAIMGLIVAFMSLIIVTFVQSLFYIY